MCTPRGNRPLSLTLAAWPLLTAQLAALVPHTAGLDIARCVATARILMPRTVVRLSAGRMNFSFADQVGVVAVSCHAAAIASLPWF